MKMIEKLKLKSLIMIMAIAMVSAVSVSCGDDDKPETPSSTKCELDAFPASVSLKTADGDIEVLPTARLAEFSVTQIVDGKDFPSFIVIDAAGNTWGVAKDSTSGNQGNLVLDLNASECGVGNKDITTTNTEKNGIAEVKVDLNDLKYSVVYRERDNCKDLNLEVNHFWLKGWISLPVKDSDTARYMTWGGQGLKMTPVAPSERGGEKGWYSADVTEEMLIREDGENLIKRTSFQIVFNPGGDYGESTYPEYMEGGEKPYNGDGIAVEFGVPKAADEANLKGTLATKAFVKKLTEGKYTECGLPCSTANEEKIADVKDLTPGCDLRHKTIGINIPTTEVKPYTVNFNRITLQYEIVYK